MSFRKFKVSHYALDISKNTISVGEVSDVAAINQSIEDILLTGRDERVFEEYGSFLQDVLFKNLNENTATELMKNIISLIGKYETRVKIVPNLCGITVTRAKASLDLKIGYYIIATNTVGEFNKRIVF